jgi:hypothetical protein
MTLTLFPLAGDQPRFDEFLSSVTDGSRCNPCFTCQGLIRSLEADVAISVRVVAQRKIDKARRWSKTCRHTAAKKPIGDLRIRSNVYRLLPLNWDRPTRRCLRPARCSRRVRFLWAEAIVRDGGGHQRAFVGDLPPSSITLSNSDSRIIVRLPTLVRRNFPELNHA